MIEKITCLKSSILHRRNMYCNHALNGKINSREKTRARTLITNYIVLSITQTSLLLQSYFYYLYVDETFTVSVSDIVDKMSWYVSLEYYFLNHIKQYLCHAVLFAILWTQWQLKFEIRQKVQLRNYIL